MKNLKKLSVVLFATLLSFNFTSCIDDGVSDAVDQVYLAQAEYLKAQAALREAEAQGALADAAYTQAQAALELAKAAGVDAVTAHQVALTEAQVEANGLQAQKNVIFLAEEEAKLEVALQTQLTALATAQSAYDVAMVKLGEAVAAAKDVLILEYYGDYSVVVAELQSLYEAKINAEHDLAVKELMLTAINSPVDMVSFAYYQAMLEGELARLEGLLTAEQANLVTLQAVTSEDASDTQKAIQALEDQIAALTVEFDALVIEKAEKFNDRDLAFEAWQAATADYNELTAAENLYKTAVAAKKVHTDAMAQDTLDVAAYQTIIDVTIPDAEVDVTTAEGDVTTAEGDVETAELALGEAQADPAVAGDDALTGTTLYDVLWNTQLAEANAFKAHTDAVFYYTPAYPGFPYIANLELIYTNKEAALAAYVPGTPIADLEADVLDTNTEEEAAQAAWTADPDGFTIDAGDDDVAGVNQLTTGETWVQVISFGITGPTFGTTSYDSFASVQLGEDVVDNPATPADETVTSFAVNGTTTAPWEVVTIIDGLMVGEWFNVEADDSTTQNLQRLFDAREAAYFAQNLLDIGNNGVASVTDDRDDALEALTIGYAAIGYTWPDVDGTPDFSDILAVEAFIADKLEAYGDAQVDTTDAQEDVDNAVAALGTEITPAGIAGTDDAIDNDPNTLYEDLWNAELALEEAEAALVALGTVDENKDLIALEWKEIAEIALLLPSHDYAIAYLKGEFDALAAEFNLDLTLWDLEGGHGLGQMLMDLPLYAAYLDAQNDYNDVIAEFTNISGQVSDLNFLISAYAFVQGDSDSVEDFMSDVATAIGTSKTDISDLEEDIEIQTGLVATGILDEEKAVAWVAEYQRRLDRLDLKIGAVETAADSLLARINALLN